MKTLQELKAMQKKAKAIMVNTKINFKARILARGFEEELTKQIGIIEGEIK